ncbi:hypothetical protein V2J09_018302 [Rumex salicifolius]
MQSFSHGALTSPEGEGCLTSADDKDKKEIRSKGLKAKSVTKVLEIKTARHQIPRAPYFPKHSITPVKPNVGACFSSIAETTVQERKAQNSRAAHATTPSTPLILIEMITDD